MSKEVKITGGMSKTWISDAARSPGVSKVLEQQFKKVKKDAESDADLEAYSTGESTWPYYFGATKLKGTWGDTWLIWPMNRIATRVEQEVKASARSEGFKDKEGGS